MVIAFAVEDKDIKKWVKYYKKYATIGKDPETGHLLRRLKENEFSSIDCDTHFKADKYAKYETIVNKRLDLE